SSLDNLPHSVTEVLKYRANQDLGFGNDRIEIISAQKRTWSDGCLGLEFPDLGCTEALVEGWFIEVTRGDRLLKYRSDSTGEKIYLANGTEVLPDTVRKAIFKEILPLFPINIDKIKLTQAFPRLLDGCLGVYADESTVCNEVGIPGWQIVLEEGEKRWVFHTNQDGSRIRFNLAASYFGNSRERKPKPFPIR
ncbi:MAG: hypothetical protein F6K24_33505, partial [Okeania sp. SIO2D1]|nr:hypothetical protein [Okeania sp. SIO2D1]